MLDPLDTENRILLDTLRRTRRKAWLVLTAEQMCQHGWRMAAWVLLFAALWLFEAPQFFGMTGQLAALLVFFLGIAALIKLDIVKLEIPTPEDIDRRLETGSAFRRGQIRTIEDRLANPHKRSTRELWDKGQKQMLETMPGLQNPAARRLMVRLDPYGIRFAVILLLISAFLIAGEDWRNRLFAGLLPVTPTYILAQGQSDELWITPPEYTGMPAVHITGNKLAEPIKVPQDSKIKIRAHSIIGNLLPPKLTMGDKTTPLPLLGDGLFGLETTIEPAPADSIIVSQLLMTRSDWDYEYIPDTPPVVRLDDTPADKKTDEKTAKENKESEDLESKGKPPEQKPDMPPAPKVPDNQNPEKGEPALPYEILANAQIRFPLVVKDDYGVTDMTMTMRLDPVVTEKPRGKEAAETRPVMSAPSVEMKVQPIYDLTGHTWAGLPVLFEFSVKDHKGQTAKTESISLNLPERKFEHPVAKLLIALRKKLAWSPGNDFSQIAAELEAVLTAPDLFHNDLVAYLSIRAASARLSYTKLSDPKEIEKTALTVIDLLWETALSIEDGNLSMAMRNLRQAQKELENALRDPNTGPDEIARLMDNMRESMMEYFIELSRELEKRMAEGEDMPNFSPEDMAKMISPDALAEMMNQLESDLQSGDRDAAREKLSQLQNLMDMMDPSMEAPLPEDMQMAMEGINELQKLIESQEQLRDQTQKQADQQARQNMMMRPFDKDLGKPSLPDPKVIEELGLKGMPPPPSPVIPDATAMENGQPPASVPPDAVDDKSHEDTLNSAETRVESTPNKTEQEALRYILGSLMLESSEKLGEVPESMGKAELEMRGSSDNLEANKPAQAVPHQDKAIEYLKEAQQQLQEKLKTRMQQMVGMGFSGGQKYDPLGRPYGGEQEGNGPHHGSQVKIPDEAEKKRVEEILKELRRRSGEMDRPPQEREYYRRLLRQF